MKRRFNVAKLLPNSEWYSARTLWGNTWANWFILLGSRERGKSYDVMKFYIRQWFKTNGRNHFYWFRLSDTEQKSLLNNNAINLIDPDLHRRFFTSQGFELLTNANRVYVIKRDKNGKIIRGSKKLLCYVMCLGGAGNAKGNALFDKDWLKENPDCWYNICLDEFNRVEGQRKTFDIVNNLKIQIENIIRSTSNRVRIVCIANNVGSCSDLLAGFNFIPHEFGIFKLRKKGVLIHNIPNSEKYEARRSKSALNKAFPMELDSNYTNSQIMDRSLIIPSKTRLKKPMMVIKFQKDPSKWYTLHEGGIIAPYNKEQCRVVAMRRYIDEAYNQQLMQMVVDSFNNRVYKYRNLMCFITFQNQLELLKPEKA